MIKLSNDTQKIIAFAVKYCDLVDISSLLIDKNGIRAKQDEKAVYLIEPGDYSFLEFDTLYINRVKALSPRIKMFETSKIDYSIDAEVKELADDTKIVSQLLLKGGKTKVKFNTSILTKGTNLPREMRDPKYYSFTIQSSDLTILKKGISAMGAEQFKIYNKDDNVHCEIVDIERDSLNQEVSSEYELLDEDAPQDFEFMYNFKILFPLLQEAGRQSEKIEIQVTRKGVICLIINGLSMYIFPEVD